MLEDGPASNTSDAMVSSHTPSALAQAATTSVSTSVEPTEVQNDLPQLREDRQSSVTTGTGPHNFSLLEEAIGTKRNLTQSTSSTSVSSRGEKQTSGGDSVTAENSCDAMAVVAESTEQPQTHTDLDLATKAPSAIHSLETQDTFFEDLATAEDEDCTISDPQGPTILRECVGSMSSTTMMLSDEESVCEMMDWEDSTDDGEFFGGFSDLTSSENNSLLEEEGTLVEEREGGINTEQEFSEQTQVDSPAQQTLSPTVADSDWEMLGEFSDSETQPHSLGMLGPAKPLDLEPPFVSAFSSTPTVPDSTQDCSFTAEIDEEDFYWD